MDNRLQNLFKTGKLLYGGDYNPEQWLDSPDILKEDIRLMKKAHINVATLGVFSWSLLEPEEGNYQLGWLEEMINCLYKNGIYTVLATPSGARPIWLDETYPEVLRVDKNGVRHLHGVRHNHCMTSPAYRRIVRAMDRELAKRFGSNPAVLLWHISNEFGGECYCPLCVKKFQDYLERKFEGDIEKLNHAWWTTFWSHRYQKFSQVLPPFAHGETSIMGLNLEWKRFTTFNMTDYMKEEIAVLRELTPDIPVTANFMKLYPGLDYRLMAEELDIISWDSYPKFHNDYETLYDTAMENSFDNAVMRGLKANTPFLMMESAPGMVNWHPYNKMQRPGMHSLMAMQTIACGGDSHMYFQWRKGRGSFEQYHGAVIDHLGRDDTRIYREACETGALLKQLAEVAGSTIKADAAVLFDWDNRWAIADMAGLAQERKCYEETCMKQYQKLCAMGLEVDIVSRDADFSGYRLVAAPMMYLTGEKTADRLKAYVKGGGQLIATYLCGYVDENTLCYLGGFPGGGLTELFGIYTEEIDSLYPKDSNHAIFSDETVYPVTDFAEVVKILNADIRAVYDSDYYKGMPVVTKNKYGSGAAWYAGARISPEGMEKIYTECIRDAKIRLQKIPCGIEHHCRRKGNITYDFYLNYGEEEITVKNISGVNLLTGESIEKEAVIEPWNGIVIKGEDNGRVEKL